MDSQRTQPQTQPLPAWRSAEEIELGRAFSKKLLFDLITFDTLLSCEILYEFDDPSDSVGPGSTAFTVTAVPAVVSARPRDTASWAVLVHAVVNHFHRYLQADSLEIKMMRPQLFRFIAPI